MISSTEPVICGLVISAHVASGWLRDDRVTVAEAAVRLGYDSEAAFSRAFKRFSGLPPSSVRRQDRDEGSRASRARVP
ncbi:helix-turn-helix domain-containing protein [Sorangium sp. So ce362]|uniref:helix-turn-helix domain-containing protein n=1 Tax=Sorangium sp. So ce362 TaxID=3133303 RepID=UPI003F6148AF